MRSVREDGGWVLYLYRFWKRGYLHWHYNSVYILVFPGAYLHHLLNVNRSLMINSPCIDGMDIAMEEIFNCIYCTECVSSLGGIGTVRMCIDE